MGLAFSSLYQYFFGVGQFKIVMVGLDNAGKSTILYRLCAALHLPCRVMRKVLTLCTAALAGTWAM